MGIKRTGIVPTFVFYHNMECEFGHGSVIVSNSGMATVTVDFRSEKSTVTNA